VKKLVQWAVSTFSSDYYLAVVYSDPHLKYKGRTFDAEQERLLELHQGLFIKARNALSNGVVHQYVECSGLYECGPFVSSPEFAALFRWPASSRPECGYGSLKAYNSERYKAVALLETETQFYMFGPASTLLCGVSLAEVMYCQSLEDVCMVTKKRPLAGVPDIWLSLDDPFVASGFKRNDEPAPALELESLVFDEHTVVVPGNGRDSSQCFFVGPGLWEAKRIVPASVLFSNFLGSRQGTSQHIIL